MTERAITRIRGVARGSITRLRNKIKDLQSKARDPEALAHVWNVADKLKDLDVEFQTLHMSLVELLEDEDDLEENKKNWMSMMTKWLP